MPNSRSDDERRASLQRLFRQITRRDRTDDAQTLRADLVHRVAARVPGRKVEIDQVDRRNADRIQRRVIVEDIAPAE